MSESLAVINQKCYVPNVRVTSTRQFLSSISFVENIFSQGLEVVEMGTEDGAPELAKVGVLGVVDLSNTPWVDACANGLSVNVNLFLGADDGKRKKILRST